MLRVWAAPTCLPRRRTRVRLRTEGSAGRSRRGFGCREEEDDSARVIGAGDALAGGIHNLFGMLFESRQPGRMTVELDPLPVAPVDAPLDESEAFRVVLGNAVYSAPWFEVSAPRL